MGTIRKRADNGKLFLDFRYQGKRCREQTNFDDTVANRKRLNAFLQRIDSEIANGSFSYERSFPGSKTTKSLRTVDSPAQPANALAFVTHLPMPSVSPAMNAAPIACGLLPSFEAFVETWVQENEVSWRRSYRRTVEDIINKHLVPRFKGRGVGSLTREELLKLRSELAKVPGRKKETLSPRRINAIMNVMSLILKEASDRYQFTCPYYNIKPLKIPKSDVQPFTLAEVKTILATVREDYRDYFTVRFFTGMRTGEVDGLKWEYVDFERRIILIRETIVAGQVEDEAKTQESIRDIQMSQIVFDALKRQFVSTGRRGRFVFCTRDGSPCDHNNVTKRVWYPLLRHLGLKLRRPYQTRHTAATLWLAAGENPEWIARQMGHTSTEMLFKVYSRYVPNLTRQDGSAFERLITNAISDSPLDVTAAIAAKETSHE
ncbi:MAG: DUF3596 domain-containing protein [Rhodocyclaceae bacterium]|nr:MAG: DUF3596 domain-containing protein [Pseudomonadota bacterium]